MRDAFGGAFFINLMLIFFIVYICFIAVALNYAKAFRIKNTIINFIEEKEGYNQSDNLIPDYVKSMNYYVTSVGPWESSTKPGEVEVNGSNGCTSMGYCIKEMYSDELRGTYYKVTTFIEISFPFFGINIAVPISGETRVVGK